MADQTTPMVLTAYGPKPMVQIMAELQAPFYWADLEWRVGSTNSGKTEGYALTYITNRAVQDRLDAVMGMGFWRNERFEAFRTTGVLAGLSLLINGEWITKWDGADQTDIESTKGGFSDSMKRCAYHWGIGRYLYNLPQFWVALEQRGRSAIIKGEPPLDKFPEWALPPDDPALARKKGGQGGNQRQAPPPSPPVKQVPPPQPKVEPSASPAPAKPVLPSLQAQFISPEQVKRFWAIAGERNWKPEQVKPIIEAAGFSSTKEITVDKYEALIRVLETEVPGMEATANAG